ARPAPLRRERQDRGVRPIVSRVLASVMPGLVTGIRPVGWAKARECGPCPRVHSWARRFAPLPTLLLLLAPLPARAAPVEDFYRGKALTLIIASGVAGGYDTYARVVARHFADHVPGHPAIIAKNIPAGGGLTAANTLYAVSARDGLTIAALTNGVAMDPLFGNPGARFDAQEFGWIGSIGKLQNVCPTWHESPIRTIAAAREREVVVAAAGATSNTAIVPRVLNTLLGTRFKIVAGYDPGAGLNMALESREVEGICG